MSSNGYPSLYAACMVFNAACLSPVSSYTRAAENRTSLSAGASCKARAIRCRASAPFPSFAQYSAALLSVAAPAPSAETNS